MYDRETVQLIKNAEPLAGLDVETLPQLLTEAYSQVVAARIGAAGEQERLFDSEWDDTLSQLRKIAETYEGLTIFLPEDNPHRNSCAFVAASAWHTLGQARQIAERTASNRLEATSVTDMSIAPEVSACLLFLIADHHSDAAEAAKLFHHSTLDPSAARTTRGLAALASGEGGQLQDYVNLSVSDRPQSHADYGMKAVGTVWASLAHALRALSQVALGQSTPEDPLSIIDGTLETMAAAQSTRTIEGIEVHIRPHLEGPYHFARLLRYAARRLLSTAVIRVTTPPETRPGPWFDFLRHTAMRRPFLWQNHLRALDQGFLETGKSFVVTFPTGAGKSTITTLRIAAEILRGRKVAVLVPTRALVGQVSRELDAALRPFVGGVVGGSLLEEFGEYPVGKISVQTPEQCLAYLASGTSIHTDLGLIVVDEAHQLSGETPTESGTPPPPPDRRSVDAMWALLTLLQRSPEADVVLVSAMVRNGAELASWIAAITNRPAAVLELPWKPTRQMRGALVYRQPDIARLQRTVEERRRERTGAPRVRDKEELEAQAFGLICHEQVWEHDSSYSIVPLLSAPMPLSLGSNWSLTSNRNQVSGKLLGQMAGIGMRPIVFSQNVGWTRSIAKVAAAELESAGNESVSLTRMEQDLLDAAAIELGDRELVEGFVDGHIGVHHGLLLWSEREAVESAFQRKDGLCGLVATPTVAQGLNLPAEAVIIAGDDRWAGGIHEVGMQPLKAHELLNAAGRAGRAGHFAHGLVINVPGAVLAFSESEDSFGLPNLDRLMSIFGLPDQCLDVIDPITQVLDRIQVNGPSEEVSRYVVRRLAGFNDSEVSRFLRITLSNAMRSEIDINVTKQVSLINQAAKTIDYIDDDIEHWRPLACLTGTAPGVLADIASRVHSPTELETWEFPQWLQYVTQEVIGNLFNLLDASHPGLTSILPRKQSGNGPAAHFEETTEEWEGRWQHVLATVLPAWQLGEPLAIVDDMLRESRGGGTNITRGHLGRRFAIRTAPVVALGASIVCRVVLEVVGEDLPTHSMQQLSLLPGCIREGFDVPDKLLLFWQRRHLQGRWPRVAIHAAFGTLRTSLPSWQQVPEVDERRRLIREQWSL